MFTPYIPTLFIQLSPWPKAQRLENCAPNGSCTWDTRGHCHVMLGLVLWHGESGAGRVTIDQQTEYPKSGKITLKITPAKTALFAIKLEIPHWSGRTKVQVNGSAGEAGTPYQTWLPVKNAPRMTSFSRSNPLRSVRP